MTQWTQKVDKRRSRDIREGEEQKTSNKRSSLCSSEARWGRILSPLSMVFWVISWLCQTTTTVRCYASKEKKEMDGLPISTKRFLTFCAVLAEVSIKIISFSSAYCCASSVGTLRLLSISHLFPAKAITTLGSPRRCSSLTHDFAPLKVS